MSSLEDLLHPVSPATFFAEHHDRAPLHIPALPGGRKQDVLTWEAFNALLNQSVVWTPNTLRLLRDNTPVPADQYCRQTQSINGEIWRPSPRKVEVFLSAGCSLVLNDVVYLHPPAAELGEMLGERFGARVGGNIYCSFKGVQAFGTHFDNHHVFAIQIHGEKVWNIYEARAENPVDLPPENAGQWFAQTRGGLKMQVRMKPGDVLYLPRGTYHDALTEDGESLHLTLSVDPLNERELFDILARAAASDTAFGAYLPPAADDPDAMKTRLADWSRRVADLAASPAFFDAVVATQRRLQPAPADYTLPVRKPVTLYRTTGRAFPPCSPAMREVYDWAIADRQFALEDLVAQFDGLSEAEVRAGVAAAEQAGAVARI